MIISQLVFKHVTVFLTGPKCVYIIWDIKKMYLFISCLFIDKKIKADMTPKC